MEKRRSSSSCGTDVARSQHCSFSQRGNGRYQGPGRLPRRVQYDVLEGDTSTRTGVAVLARCFVADSTPPFALPGKTATDCAVRCSLSLLPRVRCSVFGSGTVSAQAVRVQTGRTTCCFVPSSLLLQD